ncbi:MAG: GntR family transcriptional regulator [Chloroflexi bacterium]|nr:MAG: GntR family transcriptional regulator [Chloroflexota bacterium]
MSVRQTNKRNKHEQAYSIIRERIFNGTYVPGYRLVIDALARELGISPVPIREAIRRLEAEGWLEYRPNAGAQVAAVDASKYGEEMTVLALLEGYATALASTHLDTEGVKHLREINAGMHRTLQSADLPAFSRLNKAFHFFIYDLCQNSYLVELLRETWDRLEVRGHTDFSYIPQRSWFSIEEHTQLLDMIERHASQDEIEQMVREHKLRTYEAYRTSPRYASRSTELFEAGENGRDTV